MDKETIFRKALQEHKARIQGICSRYLSDADDRADVYQEIVINIWKNLDKWRGEAQIGTWIFRIAVNTCLLHLRKEKRRNQVMEHEQKKEIQNIPDPSTNTPDGPDERKYAFFRIFLGKLSPIDRMTVSLYLEEVSSREIAEVTGLTEGNVRVRLHRIREQIKKEWEERYGTR